MRRKLLTSVALVGALIGLSACGTPNTESVSSGISAEAGASQSPAQDGQQSQDGQPQSGDQGSQPAMPEPDLEGIPEVVATVNGEEIRGDEFAATYESQFQQLALQAQLSGEELDQDALKQQAAEALVDRELLVQHAQASGHEATEEEVESLLQQTAESQQLGSVDELLAAYEEQGFDAEQVRADAAKQILLTKAIEDIEVPEPTEEELRELYDQVVAAQPPATEGEDGASSAPEVPSYEELKPQLEQQVTTQKQNEAIMETMERLRDEADVEIRL